MKSSLAPALALSLLSSLPLRAQSGYECADVVKRAAEINHFGDIPPVAKVLTAEGLSRENNDLVTDYLEFKRQRGMPKDDKALTDSQKDQLKPFDQAMRKLQAPLLEPGWAKVYGWERIEELGYAEGNSARLYLIKNRIAAFSLRQPGGQITYGLAPDECVVNYIYRGSVLDGDVFKMKGVSKATCTRSPKWATWRSGLPEGKRSYEDVCRVVGGYLTAPSFCECPGAGADWDPYSKDCGKRRPEDVVSEELKATKAHLFDVTKPNLDILKALCEDNASLFTALKKVDKASPGKALNAAVAAPGGKVNKRNR
ncbi:MAG: hypothetical protein EKK29_18975 [Hyphomicrobiales bacterium]|nr:MAG: hypothetical protein EKK29_18975 [Hyphomicrobiales bacterium]